MIVSKNGRLQQYLNIASLLVVYFIVVNFLLYLFWLLARNLSSENLFNSSLIDKYNEFYDFTFLYAFPFLIASPFGSSPVGIILCIAIVAIIMWAFVFSYSRGIASRIAFLLTYILLCLLQYFTVGHLFDVLVIDEGFSAL